MPTPLKGFVDLTTATRIADAVARALPPSDFDREVFLSVAAFGLEDLGLKKRVGHIADALAQATTPDDYPGAVAGVVSAAEAADLDFWAAWPLTDYAGRYGSDHPDVALDALGALTARASAEFAIRPYLVERTDLTMARLRKWSLADDVHLRRLVSEGTRPRLPWGTRLLALQRDPSPMLPLLDRLHDDPEEYVRRSVANHANDISKDHPRVAVDLAAGWVEGAQDGASRVPPAQTERTVRRALRTLVKAGHGPALRVLGYDPDLLLPATLSLSTDVVPFGEILECDLTVSVPTDRVEPVPLVVDYVVHLLRANGTRTPKVFKLATPTAAPGDVIVLSVRHSFRAVTVRRYYPGTHRIEALVNGAVVAGADFELAPGVGEVG